MELCAPTLYPYVHGRPQRRGSYTRVQPACVVAWQYDINSRMQETPLVLYPLLVPTPWPFQLSTFNHPKRRDAAGQETFVSTSSPPPPRRHPQSRDQHSYRHLCYVCVETFWTNFPIIWETSGGKMPRCCTETSICVSSQERMFFFRGLNTSR